MRKISLNICQRYKSNSAKYNAIDVAHIISQAKHASMCGIKWHLTDVKRRVCKYRAEYHLQLILLLAYSCKHAESILCVVTRFIMKNLLCFLSYFFLVFFFDSATFFPTWLIHSRPTLTRFVSIKNYFRKSRRKLFSCELIRKAI